MHVLMLSGVPPGSAWQKVEDPNQGKAECASMINISSEIQFSPKM